MGNWLGEVFAIGYTLGFYVKYTGWKETGAGDKSTIPIRIFNEPRLVESEDGFRVPDGWNAISDGYEPTKIWFEENKVSRYYMDVWRANWLTWYDKAKVTPPVLLQAEYAVAGEPEIQKDLKDLANANTYESHQIIS